MDTSTAFLNRLVDNSPLLIVGLFGLVHYAKKMRLKVQTGRLRPEQAKKNFLKISIVCYALILFGMLRVFRVLR